MNLREEYRSQLILASLQSLAIIGGSLFVATILKTRGYDSATQDLPFKIALIRNYGFLLILIPLAWICLTLFWEQSRTNDFTKRDTIISGSLLLFTLVIYFFIVGAQVGSSVIQVIE